MIILIKETLLFLLFHNIYINTPYFPRINEIDYLKHKPNDLKHFKNINCYSLSSFNYTILGLFLIKYNSGLFYIDQFLPYFIIMQGPISFISDSTYVDKYHWIHDLDISLASYNSTLSIGVFFYTYNIWKLSNIYYIILILGKICHLMSRYSFEKKKYKHYEIFHILWHIIVPYNSMLMFYKINMQNKYIQT